MKKYRKLIKMVLDKPMGFALVSSFFTCIIGLLVFRPFFEENDDIAVSFMTEGAYGDNNFHLVFVNSLLGRLECLLCRFVPSVRWHIMLQFIFIFIAFLALTYYLSHYKKGRTASFIVQLACFYELYVSVQFTKTVSFISIVGIMIILDTVKRRLTLKYEKKSDEYNALLRIAFDRKSERLSLILAYVLILYGLLLRKGAFEMAVLVALIPGAIQLIRLVMKNGYKCIGYYAAYIVPVFVVMLLLTQIDKGLYNSSDEWNYYKHYTSKRSAMVDIHYDALQYDIYGDELSKLGVSENDAFMYVTWQFADESVVTPELMGNIADITADRNIGIDFLKALVQNVYNDFFVFNATVLATIFLLCMIFMISKWNSLGKLFSLAEGALLLGLFFYYHYKNRWCHRGVFSSLMVIIVVCIFVLLTESRSYFVSKNTKRNMNAAIGTSFSVLMMLMIVTAVSSRLGNEFDYQEYLRRDKSFEVLQMYMEENKDKLFVADTFTIGDMYKYSVFSPLHKGALDNYVTTGSWMSASPIEHEIVEKYGYYDPFDALRRGSDNVILIDNFTPDRKALFLTEHGEGPRYAAEYIENVCGYNLYIIR